jgi:hypothetical protein
VQAFVPQTSTAALARVGVTKGQLNTHKYKHRPLDFVLQQELGMDTVMESDNPKVAVTAVQWSVCFFFAHAHTRTHMRTRTHAP